VAKQGEMIAAFDAALKSNAEVTRQLLEVVEQLAKAPTADPVQQPKQSFKKTEAEGKAEKFASVVEALKTLKAKN
jgi:hypothetical protein